MASSTRMLQYDAGYPLYGISFSNSPAHPFRVALTTLSSTPTNKLIVVDASNQSSSSSSSSSSYEHQHHHHHQHHQHHHNNNDSYHPPNGSSGSQRLSQIASCNLNLPATKVGWEPKDSVHGTRYDDGGRGELIATSGDALRIFEISKEWETDARGAGGAGGYVGKNGWAGMNEEPGYAVRSRSVLTNSKTPHTSLPPVTSFSWNPKSPNSIVTCSIDTTATLWDINTSQALTQLIAHDRAVYDLSWLPDSSDIFVSVGADGSLRAFDLRQLEHSTILYESSKETPLARIAFSKKEQHMMACFGLDDSKILVLDMRSPGQPVAELVGHQAPLGGIAWGSPGVGSRSEPTGGGWLASCGDDSQLLLYDLTAPLPESRPPSTQPPNTRASSSNPYALSPPMTPNSQSQPHSQAQSRSQSQSRSSPSIDAIEMLPVKGWTADAEVNNLAFNEKGDWVGCVSGGRLSVLQV
ncbi:WD-repeat protein 68 [Kwoniella heveanensis BCC8398]|uniref:WD-repeat protein 68 n=1 Tax=Kwoniella heveanensis BCC8398 TaxID=1296120 RepID=A0A1B9GMV5_9TREE|nr:WD-repeat protein 68 [Kwoniella heveanensis BCC8398]